MTHPTIAMMADEQKRKELEHRAREHWKTNQAITRPAGKITALVMPVAALIIRALR